MTKVEQIERLKKMRDMARKAIRVTDEVVLNKEVEVIDDKKGSFISVGGYFDYMLIDIIDMIEKLEADAE